ncbi:hypothetical protein [Kitasatospora sp. NBC_01539]|uniref:hypothetical protein n=1 Tax=Kitasatospora sp. NBC_01539 TaxID=2903577 RepID=UPI0038601968
MSTNGWFFLAMSVMLIWIPAAMHLTVRCLDGRTKAVVALRAAVVVPVLCGLALGLWGLASLVPVSRCDHDPGPACEIHTP